MSNYMSLFYVDVITFPGPYLNADWYDTCQ